MFFGRRGTFFRLRRLCRVFGHFNPGRAGERWWGEEETFDFAASNSPGTFFSHFWEEYLHNENDKLRDWTVSRIQLGVEVGR